MQKHIKKEEVEFYILIFSRKVSKKWLRISGQDKIIKTHLPQLNTTIRPGKNTRENQRRTVKGSMKVNSFCYGDT